MGLDSPEKGRLTFWMLTLLWLGYDVPPSHRRDRSY